ncbi:trypsin-like serine peptidase [Streptomyces puniciscabiei]
MASADHQEGDVLPPVSSQADRLPDQDRTKAGNGAVWGNGPIDSIGRLFTTITEIDPWGNLQHRDISCTATVVSDPANPSHSVVATANHCVASYPYYKNNDPRQGPDWSRPVWNTNLYFVPGYRDGAAPHGGFTIKTVIASHGYTYGGDVSQDFAMLAMNPTADGHSIAEVGTQKIAFNAPRAGRFAYDFGYTAVGGQEPWKTGQLLGYCAGEVAHESDPSLSQLFGIPCEMDKGSSGGPTLVDFDPVTETGTVIGVNSLESSTPDGEYTIDHTPLDDTARQEYALAKQQACE